MCLTDALDGYIARKWNQVSDLGKFLDPLADKLAVDLPLIIFVAKDQASMWAVILIIGREFFVTGVRLLAAGQSLVIAADNWGKLKTVLQMAAVFMFIVGIPHANSLLWVSVGFSIISGWKIWNQAKTVFKQS